jgi:hypothetical protein
MKARITALLCVLMLAASGTAAMAQLQSGTIAGTITDASGGVLPGVSVTLTGSAAPQTFTTGSDGQFRFLNLPPGSYKLTAMLQGFGTVVRDEIAVSVGQNVDLPLAMKVASVQESVTVTGASPVVDAKQMGTATTFTQAELSRIPTSRDPWALLRTVPGVTLDRVNVGGNETGQQSTFVSKGARRDDAVWTMDGIPITDMATTGASPTYFDFDAFDEIRISTGGNDIRQATGALGLNMVVKRGTNQLRGTARGYLLTENWEASNLPDELIRRGVTPATADHNQQISEAGIDVGGPIMKDKLFFWGSYADQDIRLYRQSARGTDRTILKTYNVKINWQIGRNDGFNFLLFNGDKVKNGRAPGNALFEPTSARYNQGNYYNDNPFHGLWKLEHNKIFGSDLFVTSKYAYYNTGFTLESIGSLTEQMGISALAGQTFGSTNALYFLRPQHTVNVDSNYFRQIGGTGHNLKFGTGWRRTDAFAQTIYPGNGVVAYENSATDFRARVYREGAGTNRSQYFNLYLGDTISMGRVTIDLGVRYDRQWGSALASSTASNSAFPSIVPGISFPGYDKPFTWSDVTPRAGVTYALDAGSKTILRFNFSRNASQLSGIGGNIGYANPSSGAGWVEYRWVDSNGDHLAQTNEVLVNQPLLASGGGFNTANPTSVASANRIDPNLSAPIGNGVVIGVDRELMPNLAVQVNYTWSRGTNLTWNPFIGLTAADYALGTPLTGTRPDGTTYSYPTYLADANKVAAVGGGRLLTNWPGYMTKFSGFEVSVNKRMSNKWQMRLSAAHNNATEDYEMNPAQGDNGQLTRIDIFPLITGGQQAPRSGGSGSGDVFVNQKWNFNVNGAYQFPWDVEFAGNLFGKQGTPFVLYRNVALGRDGTQRVMVSSELDTYRFANLWNLDVSLSKNIRFGRGSLRIIGDLFNVANANTEITRERNLGSTNYGVLGSNLSPRVFRIGLRLNF